MSARRNLLALLVAAGACSPKGGAGAGTADTASVAPPAAAPTDSIAASRDTGRRADSDTTAMRPPGQPKATPAMGRDSAFGPTFGVDSTGKVIPLAPKKP